MRAAAVVFCALLVNFLLFLAVPLLQNILGFGHSDRISNLSPRELVPAAIMSKEPEKPQVVKRIRTITADQSRTQSLDFGLKMKFSPDLSVAGSGSGGAAMETGNLEAVIFEEGETDEELAAISIQPIPYPERARELGMQGVLLIELLIGTDGHVESVNILKSPHTSISAAARQTAMHWKFKPASNKGIPVRVRARKEIEFRLD